MSRLFDLDITHAARWIFNCYVVHDGGDGRPLVVDAGLPCTARAALDALRDVDGPVAIACTHGHSDHVGGVSTLLDERHGDVLLPARCEAYLAGEPARTPGLREVVKLGPVVGDQPFDPVAARQFVRGAGIGYGRTAKMSLPFEVSGFLHDGEQLGKWEVIHRDSATLLSGDAVVSCDGRAWLNPEVVDPRRARETEERLRELDVRHLLPGHGRPIEGRHLLRDARSFRDRPAGPRLLARMARAFGAW
jgi:glyoxylase-like metal-dependent hydrolase (beta-lactamase superfamily II)